jgi:hypothetical protein
MLASFRKKKVLLLFQKKRFLSKSGRARKLRGARVTASLAYKVGAMVCVHAKSAAGATPLAPRRQQPGREIESCGDIPGRQHVVDGFTAAAGAVRRQRPPANVDVATDRAMRMTSAPSCAKVRPPSGGTTKAETSTMRRSLRMPGMPFVTRW